MNETKRKVKERKGVEEVNEVEDGERRKRIELVQGERNGEKSREGKTGGGGMGVDRQSEIVGNINPLQ